ncbi:nitroreductase family protein [Neomegalonema perideroedes]|uniref:nitroreductase family protein n=1 Tax=Neomegalonema perideroedes TaxID=217219 RepID=UPI000378E7AF|nr:nitroreductase family protein [Neomegalonema perideroedes]
MIEAFKKRRTQYALGKNLPLPPKEIDALIRETVRLAPSSFNSQSSRAVILFGAESVKFWNIVKEALRPIVPAADFPNTDKKIDSFAAGAGTVLFFEDEAVVRDLQEKFPLYAANFPGFSMQSGGMAQFAVWTALANIGVGASLQHYNPLIDAEVAKAWNLPTSWKLMAQMPFGSNEAPLAAKTFVPDETRFRSFA